MTKFKLSIITITYNNPGLKRTIDSVLAQKYPSKDFEHIIVDNVSDDGTEDMVRSYIEKSPYKVAYIREKDKGRYDAMNKGIKVAQGEYLSFMNAGDHFYDGFAVKNILDNSKGHDIVYGDVNVSNKGSESVYCPPDHVGFNYFLNGAALPHQASIIKRSLFDRLGLYDDSFKIIADWKFFLLAICKFKCTYLHINKTIATYYFDGISSLPESVGPTELEKSRVYNESFSCVEEKAMRSDRDTHDRLGSSTRARFETPILFVTFNRPDVTKRVFAEIRKIKPSRLYVASDGARSYKSGEEKLVRETRDHIMKSIDWDCEVKVLFRDVNLGCGRAVSSAINWFFGQEKEGIILEDDCLPNQHFFHFCAELLNKYRDNKKVMHISGDQFISNFDNGASYYFAKIMHCWGWATWADRWKEYEFNLANYDDRNIQKVSKDMMVQSYWMNYLQMMKRGEINTWDYQWTFKIIEKDGLCINPSKNLISNIGYGDASTNGFKNDNPNVNLPIHNIDEIIHPKLVQIDDYAVEYIFRYHYGINLSRVVKNSLKFSIKSLWGRLLSSLRHR